MSKSEVLQGTVYWQEIREGLFVHNEEWDKTIDRLPDLIDHRVVLNKLQSLEQIFASGLKGFGTIGYKQVEVAPEPEILLSGHALIDGYYTVENLFLQWVYQFYVVEGIANNFHSKPLPEWSPMFISLVEEHLHAMTYIAALIFGYEELEFKALVTKDRFDAYEYHVKEKVRELTSTLYAKCAEYGESFRRHGLQGTLPRLWDKIARYAQLSALGRDAKYEPKRDSAKDLLGYCIIAWSLVHELEDHVNPEIGNGEISEAK